MSDKKEQALKLIQRLEEEYDFLPKCSLWKDLKELLVRCCRDTDLLDLLEQYGSTDQEGEKIKVTWSVQQHMDARGELVLLFDLCPEVMTVPRTSVREALEEYLHDED